MNLSPVANHLWQSTAFALLAALLALALRKSHARARYWLWMAASLKFLLPFSMLTAFGAQFEWRTAPLAMRETAASAIDGIGAPFGAPALNGPSSAPAATSLVAISIAWALGCVALLAVWFVRWRRIAAMVREARPIGEGRAAGALRRARSRAGFDAEIRLASTQAPIEPGVFGWFRPVLLLPAAIVERLSDAQLEAILTHELCHVRRRDNLAAVIHMLVEAVFWFHPLVWWLGGRLLEERERACDEEVLRLGGDSRVYAESILRACEFCLRSPLECVSGVTGGELKMRIERIMLRQFARQLGAGGKLMLLGAAVMAVAGPILVGVANAPVARAQSQAAAETFDAVSIKLAPAGRRGSGFITDPGRMVMKNVTLADCILVAYAIQRFQLFGKDLPSERYDIEATAPTHPGRILDSRYEAMLQAMLADRFQLKFHRDSKVMSVYALEVASGGPKIKQSVEPGLSTRSTPGHVMATGATMQEWATYLTRRLGRPVVDLTDLKGLYDFSLDWMPSEGEASLEPPDPDHPRSSDPTGGPSIYTAIREQLGLQLRSKKLPVEILIVDHAERASAN